MVNIATPESINGLPVISHTEEVSMGPQEKPGQVILKIVGILILIHKNVGEEVFIVLPDSNVINYERLSFASESG